METRRRAGARRASSTVILAVSGGLCAFLLRRNANEARVATEAEALAGPAGDVAVAQAGDA